MTLPEKMVRIWILLVGLSVLSVFSKPLNLVFAQPTVAKSAKPAAALEEPAVTRSAANPAKDEASAAEAARLMGIRDQAKPIEIGAPLPPLEERLARKITLDVRDMNVIDVVKFLAMKGDFNVVTSSSVEGRATVLLKSVSIKDALDIVAIANRLAYQIQNDIIQVMTATEYEVMYGKQFSDKTEVAIERLHYAKPSYVLAALDNVKSNIGKIIIDEDTGSVVMIDTPEGIQRMQAAIKNMEQPLETKIFDLKYAKADVVAEKLRARIDANAVGSITPDERSNQLVIRAFPGRLKEVETMIKNLDVQTREVLVEARVLQVVLKPSYDVGIDWNLDFRDSGNPDLRKLTFKNTYLDEARMAGSDNLFNQFGKIGYGTLDVNHFQFAIRSLQKVSDTKILSNPKILVTNNQEAKIHIGDTVPYIISTTSGTGDNAITSEDVRFVDVGLKLSVTPTINEDGFVTMRLKPEISTVVDRIESQGGGIPQVNKTEVETTVMIKDGMTIVMGGLKKDDKVHTKSGLPYLMDMPFIGRFFSRTSDNISATEIVIFITPHVIQHQEDYVTLKGDIKPFQNYTDPREELK